MTLRITDLTALAAADVADDDVLAIVDVSADETKKVTRASISPKMGSYTSQTRAFGTDYTNTSSVRALVVSVRVRHTNASGETTGVIAGTIVSQFSAEGFNTHTLIVPPSAVYRVNLVAGTANLTAWVEAPL